MSLEMETDEWLRQHLEKSNRATKEAVLKASERVEPCLEIINKECLGGRAEIEIFTPQKVEFSSKPEPITIMLIWDINVQRRTRQKIEIKIIKHSFIAVYVGDDDYPVAAHKEAFRGGTNDALSLLNKHLADELAPVIYTILQNTTGEFDTESLLK